MKSHGVIVVNSQCVADTLQCPHCGAHFVSRPGSGARRFKCFPCDAITCGNPQCDIHVPVEAKLEYIEQGKVGKYKEALVELVKLGSVL